MEARKSLVGDIDSVKRFLIFSRRGQGPSASSNRGGESPAYGAKESPKKMTCYGCKSVCSIASNLKLPQEEDLKLRFSI
ncbi:SWI/SNF complex subunit SWI3B [Pyrus ussuriensis x Pyrus communis]|uniref:SWI/SNF complex subunit SWI3B n=1 Tax=Pyrus ussuriensis x Pyrus communis TaxID=2448454 RepID=A0A5N5G734_9ROSA|nr:SWI/SNF complex subunit SWI3B [Pyrus ussuriensis x Pyrus communis]